MPKRIDSLLGFEEDPHHRGIDLSVHHAAIGRLVSDFVRIEEYLHYLLRLMLDIDDTVARAIVGQGRASDLITTIRRVAKIKHGQHQELMTAMENTFEKISALKDRRDHVAHRLFAVRGYEMAFHNSASARVLPPEFIVYTVAEINDYAIECHRLVNDLTALQALRLETMRPGTAGLLEPSLRKRLQLDKAGRRPKARKARHQ
jgi:hypothetical protein